MEGYAFFFPLDGTNLRASDSNIQDNKAQFILDFIFDALCNQNNHIKN